MKYIFLTLILAITLGFVVSEIPQLYKVEYKGALKNMMHKGDLSAKADLADYKNTEHFYALGAVENLKGEIQIWDSKPLVSNVESNELQFDKTFTKKACLLVYTSVEKWNTIEIPDTIKSYKELEMFVASAAKKNKIDITKPFPFLLEGRVDSFDWHVINWKDGDTEHSHKKHVNSGLHGSMENTEVEMLAFYSDSHHAIFTHHTTNMHIHVKTKDEKIAGHVDGLELGEKMVLKLPLVN